jgi:hypothetical protein
MISLRVENRAVSSVLTFQLICYADALWQPYTIVTVIKR